MIFKAAKPAGNILSEREILKDADEMQHWLRNPMEEYFFRKERTQRIVREFGLL